MVCRRPVDFTMLFLTALVFCVGLCVAQEQPKLSIFPNQNPITVPAKVSFGLMCEGKAEDGDFTEMKWINPEGEEIRTNVRKMDTMLKLTFPNPTVQDGGVYKCTALYSNSLPVEVEVKVDFYESIRFEECPEIQNLVVGQEGHVDCRAVANPFSPAISWEKDGVALTALSDRVVPGSSGLSISSVSEEDAGTYSLEAFVKETGSNLFKRIKVNVLSEHSKMRPNITQLQNLTKEEGKDAIFECKAEGIPKPLMTIRKDGADKDITDDPDNGMELYVFDDGEYTLLRLRITNVKRSDDGLYFCRAANAAGVAERVGHLQVQFQPDMSRTQVTSVKTWPNNPANLSCIADAIPNATIWWKFQGEYIDSGDDRFRISGAVSYSSLLVLTADRPDNEVFGAYTCEARNKLGVNAVTIYLDKELRPNITQLQNLTKEEGKEAIFECKAEGFPKPLMTIRKDGEGKDITDDPDNGMELEVFDDGEYNLLRLRITNVKRSDDGLYFCRAANAAGVAERVGHLQVQFRPDMSRTQVTSVKTWSNNPANLSCIADAIPNATIWWKFQGEPIDSGDDRFRISGAESYSSLQVLPADRPDYEVFGAYTCEAVNALGVNEITINLDKAHRPSALTQIVFDKVTSTTITFRLMGPSNTGGMPITHYNMKYKLVYQKDDPIKEVTWGKDTSYILSNLIPRAKYLFSAAAINVVGVGDYKDAIYLMPEETVPEPPLIKNKYKTISKYPDRFEVRWDVPNNNGKPILKYGIRYFLVERGLKDWTQVEKAIERSVDARDFTFELTKLKPDKFYKIELRATNEIGNSLPESVVIKTSKGTLKTTVAGKDVSPFLYTEPENSQLQGVESEAFNVSCEGAGGHCSKFSALKWTDPDGKEITSSQRNPKTVLVDNKLYLVFTSPKLKDQGNYQCSALYDGTQLERKIFIEFYAHDRIRGRKPKFQSTVYNASVEQGLTVKFYCSAESKLPLDYEWFNQAGDRIPEDSRKRVSFTNSSSSSVLTIRGVQQKEDEGQYLCMAKNMNGLENKFYNLKVVTEEDAGGLRMVTHPRGHYVRGLEGRPVLVRCGAAGGDLKKFSLPTWKTADGEEISGDDPSQARSRDLVVLTYENPRINDSASFLCTAVYEREVEIQHDVFLEFHGHKPEFLSHSQNILTEIGGFLKVPCEAEGELPIKYNWYDQTAEQITEATNSTIYATQSGNQSILTFTDVSAEDRGTYTCSASNSYGQVNKFYILKVINSTGMKPDFPVSFENVTGEAGSQLELQCLALGEKPITYDWYNQAQDKIPEDNRSSVYAVPGEKYSLLNFQKLSVAHQGTYTCTANNVHGMASKVFMLRVVE